VLKVFDLIQRDDLTPTDRARMKDEYALEELKRKEYQEALAEGLAEGLALGEAEGLARGEAQGVVKGMAQGFAQGEKHMQLSLAKNLLQLGQLEIATIAQLTGLTVAEIHSL